MILNVISCFFYIGGGFSNKLLILQFVLSYKKMCYLVIFEKAA